MVEVKKRISDLPDIEDDPRFKRLLKDYKYSCTKWRIINSCFLGAGLSLVTGPLHTIALSMQLSVIPHLTAYGDVKPEQLKQTMIGSATKKMKLLAGKEAKELAVAKAEKPLTNYEQ